VRSRSSIRNALGALSFLIAIGVLGYMGIEGASFFDALFMTVTTLSTVGYREVVPLGVAGRWFTMALILSGLGVVFYSASLVAADVIEGRLQSVLGRRRVQRQIERLTGHYIVCGFGRMGKIVCKELAAKPVPFVVVDNNPETVRYLQEQQYLYVEGDATEDDSLLAAGIRKARGVVTALSKDSDNVYVVLSARQLNPDLLIVARAEDERSEPKLIHAGATRVVSPYVIGGSRMAGALLRPAVLDVVDLATHYHSMELKIEELPVGPGGFSGGETLGTSGLREQSGLIVIAIKKANGDMLFNPDADARIQPGDRLVVMGQAASLHDLEQRLTV
jgi:voltage-gated potassium channel